MPTIFIVAFIAVLVLVALIVLIAVLFFGAHPSRGARRTTALERRLGPHVHEPLGAWVAIDNSIVVGP